MSGEQIPEISVSTAPNRSNRFRVRVAGLVLAGAGALGVGAVMAGGESPSQEAVAAASGDAGSNEFFSFSEGCLDGSQELLYVSADSDQPVTVDIGGFTGGVLEPGEGGNFPAGAKGSDYTYTISVEGQPDATVTGVADGCSEGGDGGSTTSTTDKPGTDVCPVDDKFTVKVEVQGDQQEVEYTAPDGFLVDEYCVKAGNDLDFVDVDPDAKTVVISDQDDDKDVSHFTVALTPASTTTTAPAGSTTTAPTGGSTTTVATGGSTTTVVTGGTTTTVATGGSTTTTAVTGSTVKVGKTR